MEAHSPIENAPQGYPQMLGRGFSWYWEILGLDGALPGEVPERKPCLEPFLQCGIWQPDVPHGELAYSKPNLGNKAASSNQSPGLGQALMLLIILCKERGSSCQGTSFWRPLAFLSLATITDKSFLELFICWSKQLVIFPARLMDTYDNIERMKRTWSLVSFVGNPPSVILTNLGHGPRITK